MLTLPLFYCQTITSSQTSTRSRVPARPYGASGLVIPVDHHISLLVRPVSLISNYTHTRTCAHTHTRTHIYTHSIYIYTAYIYIYIYIYISRQQLHVIDDRQRQQRQWDNLSTETHITICIHFYELVTSQISYYNHSVLTRTFRYLVFYTQRHKKMKGI